MSDSSSVRQLRLVVAVDDFDATLRLYRDVLGLREQAAFHGDGGARVAILDAGAATLEIANRAQVEMIDGIETDGGTSDRTRVGFEVDDAAATTDRFVDAGAQLEAAPRETPWRSLNSRLRTPGDLQVTLFQELETLEQRGARPGFRSEAPAAGDDGIAEVIENERQLQDPAVRRDGARLESLLAADFTEIGASGRIWDRAQIVDLLRNETVRDEAGPDEAGTDAIEMREIQARSLGTGLVLVTWLSQRAGRHARRSSLWRRDADGWRLVHHQATPLPDAAG